LSRISVDGNRFVDEAGKTVVFRGFSSSEPSKLSKDGRWNQAYFDEAKAWGANIIRFPIHPPAWRRLGEEEYLDVLDRGVSFATKAGLHVIIDWHSIGDLMSGRFQETFGSGAYLTDKKETAEFWRTIATRYGSDNTVAFFELFNEPTTLGEKPTPETWPRWKEYIEELITIIRANGGKAVPLVAGFDWAYDLTPVATDPIAADNIGYVSHPYPMKRKQPWEEKWTADWGFVAEKYPVFLTEIGFCDETEPGAHDPVISDESYGNAITAYCAQRGISYAIWVFDPDWAPRLIKDWKFTPARQGIFFKKAMQETKL
jgi:endoglucanase